jgi:hypothetical protein
MSSSSLVPNTGTRIVEYSTSAGFFLSDASGTWTRRVSGVPSTYRR